MFKKKRRGKRIYGEKASFMFALSLMHHFAKEKNEKIYILLRFPLTRGMKERGGNSAYPVKWNELFSCATYADVSSYFKWKGSVFGGRD